MCVFAEALRDDAELKQRASAFGSVVVWPGDEGKIDESSVRANVCLIKHVPSAYALWDEVLMLPIGKWIMMSLAECWEARFGEILFLKWFVCLISGSLWQSARRMHGSSKR